MRVLVTGGSGRLGRQLLDRAPPDDFSLRVLSRRAAPAAESREWTVGDLTTGAGLPDALAGVDSVLHLASDPMDSSSDVAAARQLLSQAARARIRHLLYVSIVGVDRIPYRYYRHKLAVEEIIAAGSVPWSILRVAQFHSFVDFVLRRLLAVPLVMPIPLGFRVQSVAEEEVADRLLTGLRNGPGGRLRDFAGPEIMSVRQAAAIWRRARRVWRVPVPVPIPGGVASAFRAGWNTAGDGDRGRLTWAAWLERDTT